MESFFLDESLRKIISKCQIISASPTRSGNSIQARVRCFNHQDKLKIRRTSFRVANLLNTDLKNLSEERRNEIFHTIYYDLQISMLQSTDMIINSGSLNSSAFKDKIIASKEFRILSKKIYEEILQVYKKGTFKRIMINHKLNQARKLMKSNLIWALREGLDESEIRKLLKEACVQQILES